MDKQEKDNVVKDNTSGVIDSGFYRFVSLKANRLSSATYAVSNFLADADPLKWRLRSAVLDLTMDLAPASVGSVLYRVSVLEKILQRFDGVVGLIDIALATGSVSEMNLTILKKEFLALRESLLRKSPHQFLENYLVGSLIEGPKEAPIDGEKLSFSAPKQALITPEPTTLAAPAPRQSVSEKPVNSVVDQAKNRRKQLILQYLEGKNWTSIKDIADIITDCSRKTVQRELADLVDQGILRKKGDRRWSRYTVAR